MVEGAQGAQTASVDNPVRNHLLGVDSSFLVDVAGTGVEALFESTVASVVLVLPRCCVFLGGFIGRVVNWFICF